MQQSYVSNLTVYNRHSSKGTSKEHAWRVGKAGGRVFFFWTNELSQLLVYDVPTTTALYLIFVTS